MNCPILKGIENLNEEEYNEITKCVRVEIESVAGTRNPHEKETVKSLVTNYILASSYNDQEPENEIVFLAKIKKIYTKVGKEKMTTLQNYLYVVDKVGTEIMMRLPHYRPNISTEINSACIKKMLKA